MWIHTPQPYSCFRQLFISFVLIRHCRIRREEMKIFGPEALEAKPQQQSSNTHHRHIDVRNIRYFVLSPTIRPWGIYILIEWGCGSSFQEFVLDWLEQRARPRLISTKQQKDHNLTNWWNYLMSQFLAKSPHTTLNSGMNGLWILVYHRVPNLKNNLRSVFRRPVWEIGYN